MLQELEYLDVGYRRVKQQIDKGSVTSSATQCTVSSLPFFSIYFDILKHRDLNTKHSIWHVIADELNE